MSTATLQPIVPTAAPARPASAVAPVLVFGWGNPSRGDDALGLLCIDRLRSLMAQSPSLATRVECLEDYQLQVEHVLDLVDRSAVLFVDASSSCRAPFELSHLVAGRDHSYTSHAMSPQALLQVYRDMLGQEPPPCSLLAIRAHRFGLGEPPSHEALTNLDAAYKRLHTWLRIRVANMERPPAA